MNTLSHYRSDRLYVASLLESATYTAAVAAASPSRRVGLLIGQSVITSFGYGIIVDNSAKYHFEVLLNERRWVHGKVTCYCTELKRNVFPVPHFRGGVMIIDTDKLRQRLVDRSLEYMRLCPPSNVLAREGLKNFFKEASITLDKVDFLAKDAFLVPVDENG